MPDYTQYASNFWRQPQSMAGAGSLPPANPGGGIQPLGGQALTQQQLAQQMAAMTQQQQAVYNAKQGANGAYVDLSQITANQPQNMAYAGGSPNFNEAGQSLFPGQFSDQLSSPSPLRSGGQQGGGMSGTMGGPGYGPSPLGTGGQQGGGNGSMLALMQQLGMGMGGIPQFQPQFNFQQPQYQRLGLGQQMGGGQQMAGAGGLPPYLQQLMQQLGGRGGLLGGGQRPPGASVGIGMPQQQSNPYRTPGGVSDPTTNTQIGNFRQPAGGMYSPTQGGAWQGTDAQLQQFLGPQSAAQQQYMAGGNNYLDEYNARRAARGLSTQQY